MKGDKFAKDLSFMTDKDWENLHKADLDRQERWEDEKRRLRKELEAERRVSHVKGRRLYQGEDPDEERHIRRMRIQGRKRRGEVSTLQEE